MYPAKIATDALILNYNGEFKNGVPHGKGTVTILNPKINLNPIIHGGGQQEGIRPGTLAVQNIVGFGKACQIAEQDMLKDNKHVLELRNSLLEGLKKSYDYIIIDSAPLVLVSDTLPLLQIADLVLYTTRSNFTDLNSSREQQIPGSQDDGEDTDLRNILSTSQKKQAQKLL